MTIILLHTPEGIIEVDSDTVTDQELTALGITREALNKMIPRDLAAEIDGLKNKVTELEKKWPRE